MRAMKDIILKVENLGINFGGLQALQGFNFELHREELVGLIGPNGSGKTTVFNLLTGIYKPITGAIYLESKKMNGCSTYQFVEAGMARTFQNIKLFDDCSVLENVMVAVHKEQTYRLKDVLFHTRTYKKEEEDYKYRAFGILKIMGLEEKANLYARQLSYGEQRKLEIARAIATDAKVLLLDEPAAGMNPTETQELVECIRLIREKFHLAILLIEHDMNLVMNLCEKLYVLDCGNTIAVGEPSEIATNPEVIASYLGKEY